MSSTNETALRTHPTLAVIGGGLAGLAAAEAAVRAGFRTTLFERSRVLGGRAASMFEPISGQWIDNGQHLVMGCCTETLALHDRLGLEHFFERHDTIPFSQNGGKRWNLAASRFLPPSLQLLPALLRLPFLSFKERLRLGLSIRKLVVRKMKLPTVDMHLYDSGFHCWFELEKTPNSTIENFWAPLIFSALSETPENVSCLAVEKVIRDGFLAGRDAMSVRIPTMPLRSIYHDAAASRLEEAGVEIATLSRVAKLDWTFSEDEENEPKVDSLELADGRRRAFDAYILAVPSFRVWELLHASDLDDYADQLGLDRFEPGAITTLHFWFDRRLLPAGQCHTALLGGPGQFLFCPKRVDGSKIDGVYHTVVISASHRLLEDEELTARGSGTLADRVLKQLRSTFPTVFSSNVFSAEPQLLHRRVTTHFNAVFSPRESLFMNRPLQETPFSNLALAGDWTQTHWPATMEGAVRSGLMAVETLKRITQ